MLGTTPSNDPAIMKLPHPVRVHAALPDFMKLQKMLLGREFAILERHFMNKDIVLSEACYQMTCKGQMPTFNVLTHALSGVHGNTEQGGIYASMCAVRYKILPYAMFKFEDALVELLEHTDFDDDVPVSYLLPPFPFTYVELGTQRDLETYVHNEMTGLHVLEGAYIERGEHRDFGDCLNIILTGSPVGHSDAMDDATVSVLIPLDDPNRSLKDALQFAYDSQLAQVRAMGLRETSQESKAHSLEAMKLIAKALLYLGLPDVRKETHQDRTELVKQLKALKSTAKRAKVERKVQRAYNYVLVQAPPMAEVPPRTGDGHHRSPKTHWRRGHMRMQAHGPKMSLRKMVLIRPVLVMPGHAGQPEPAPTEYHVR